MVTSLSNKLAGVSRPKRRQVLLTNKLSALRSLEEFIPISIYQHPVFIGGPVWCAFRQLHQGYEFFFSHREGKSHSSALCPRQKLDLFIA